MTGFFTWGYIATFTAASAGTYLLTEMVKRIIPMQTRILSYCVALIILLTTLIMGDAFNLNNILLSIVSAVFASATANGIYDLGEQVEWEKWTIVNKLASICRKIWLSGSGKNPESPERRYLGCETDTQR
jgi:hypothetical protein